MLSMKAWTLFPTPLNVPWRVPVRPLIASAMLGAAVVICCRGRGKTSSKGRGRVGAKLGKWKRRYDLKLRSRMLQNPSRSQKTCAQL